jgi:hypothetical protein
MPAIDRYDGPAFRLLRRFLKQGAVQPPVVKIISAEYGLISLDYPLPYYDRRMTRERAKILQPGIITELKTTLSYKTYTNLLIWLGRDYFEAIYGYEAIIPDTLNVQIALGGTGRKLSILHDWLYGDSSNLRNDQNFASTGGKVRIRGVEVNLTSEQVLDLARRAIVAGEQGVSRYQSWYVPIDDQRVAPKWLVSQITGLPVSSFVTDEARRVLAKLGILVKRV